eukprot:TRINITY_DN4315_c0_g1_i1.p3 TRINITY_DN4315_c0_g1~~TRINITY_DN4315_c0_g1_i1.p3  ORF type:complete len:111 (-),score=37.00 TRINITY_DN4315_c0_g1_i1:10-342(-)
MCIRDRSIIDCAVAGLGQCYYNKSMLGNMVTEDLLFALDCMGIEHGVDWKILLDAGDTICEKMTRENCTDAFDVDFEEELDDYKKKYQNCLLYTSPSPRDATLSRMPSSA